MKEETISIETPEKIRFHYRIAPTGSRIGAYIIDLLIQILVAVLLILLALFSGSGFATFSNRLGNDFQALAMAFLYLVYFFFQWGYFTFFELLKNGQTPGKKAMRICVIKADGESPDASTIVLRNLLRAVDAFPAFHFLGGFVSILDKKSRRLGDIVADTIIVHEIRFQLEEPAFQTKLKSSGMKEPDFAPNVKLNEEELYVIRRFLNQRHLLSTEKQSAIAEKLADKVKTRLKIKKSLNSKNILFLESVYRKHADDDTK